MFAVWAASTILFVAFIGAWTIPVKDDPIPVDKIKKIIENADNYLDENHLTQLHLPNIGFHITDPVKLQRGQFGKLSTLELQEVPVIEEIKNKDGSIIYKFNVKLGLREFVIQYDYQLNIYNKIEGKKLDTMNYGNITLSTTQNEMEVTGTVVVQADKTCNAKLHSAKYIKFGDFAIDVQPNDYPEFPEVSASIMNFVSPNIPRLTNVVLEALIFGSVIPNTFPEFLCKQLVQ